MLVLVLLVVVLVVVLLVLVVLLVVVLLLLLGRCGSGGAGCAHLAERHSLPAHGGQRRQPLHHADGVGNIRYPGWYNVHQSLFMPKKSPDQPITPASSAATSSSRQSASRNRARCCSGEPLGPVQ